MSFQKVIKSMQKLEQQHQRINRKFSSKTQNSYVYQKCLQEDELQDLRVYGYTHADTISKYKQKHRSSVESLKSTQTMFFSGAQRAKTAKVVKSVQRSQTAHHSRSKQSKLLLNYAVGEIHPKSLIKKNSLFFVNSLQQINFGNQIITSSKNNQFIRKKSIVKYKHEFGNAFEQDLQTAKLLSSSNKIKDKAKTLIIQPEKNKSEYKRHGNLQNNFFTLTQSKNNQNNQNQILPLIKIQELSKQQKILKQLNLLLFQKFNPIYCNKHTKWSDFFKLLFKQRNINKLRLYLIETSNLTINQIKLSNIQKFDEILFHILKKQKMLHFYIIQQKQDKNNSIVYQQFIISQCYSIQNHQWPKHLLRYYFKRFLLLNKQNKTIKQINQQQQISFESNIQYNIYRLQQNTKQFLSIYTLIKIKNIYFN